MNNSPSDFYNAGNQKMCSNVMHFGSCQVQQWTVYLILGVITAVLFVLFSNLGTSYHQVKTPQPHDQAVQELKAPVPVKTRHDATDNLISKLKQKGLWWINSSEKVPRYFIKKYPDDLQVVNDISIKKKVFLHSLLPHALFVRQEVLNKRERLETILGKIDCSPQDIDFDPGLEYLNRCSWSEFLSDDEVSFIQNLSRSYRTTSAAGLLERVDAVPTSIILAQGALESSWGSSRFAREGNSIFGMWTWKTKGIVPLQRDEGKTHKVRTYENILDSVRAYHLTLNRLDSYEQFRLKRMFTDDPLVMAEGLTLYSERGEEYVDEIKKVILSNELQKYDNFELSGPDLLKEPESVNKTDTAAGSE